jgi:hypothetical protein
LSGEALNSSLNKETITAPVTPMARHVQKNHISGFRSSHRSIYTMTAWILTIVLVGTTIEFQEPTPFVSLDDCRKEGFRQVRDYQEGNVKAQWECEEHESEEEGTEPPAGKDV